ncbi:MAG: DUF3800 domain-containing protein [Syntrophorhabdaceae bacterium]|nr:DUF3800 domain-containing protein [Syntrophorhabdaceae bacterium]
MPRSVYDHINIYCDESRHTSNPEDKYMVIGALSCQRNQREKLTRQINQIKKRFNTWGEFGWKTLSPNRRDFYWSLLDFFVKQNLSFRCIVVDRSALDHDRFNFGDEELGFYKLYYQMLIHWLKPSFAYHIYLDWQQNKNQTRFIGLRDALKRKLLGKTRIECLEPVSSRQMPLIQLTDLLTGAVGYVWNDQSGSNTKVLFCNDLAGSVGLENLKKSTALREEKFNIFHFTGQVK